MDIPDYKAGPALLMDGGGRVRRLQNTFHLLCESWGSLTSHNIPSPIQTTGCCLLRVEGQLTPAWSNGKHLLSWGPAAAAALQEKSTGITEV